MGTFLVSGAPPTSLQDIGRVSGELSCIYDDSTETLSRRDSHTLTLHALPDSDTPPNSDNLPNNYTLFSAVILFRTAILFQTVACLMTMTSTL
jgi:hypothetical protein